MRTQEQAVLNYLENHSKGITSMEAFEKFGVTRLSAIIYNLKDEGHRIKTTMKSARNRYGHNTNFAVYTLMK